MSTKKKLGITIIGVFISVMGVLIFNMDWEQAPYRFSSLVEKIETATGSLVEKIETATEEETDTQNQKDNFKDYYVTAPVLKSRLSPRSGKIVERLNMGQWVAVYKIKGGWALISKPNEQERWVSASYLSQVEQKSSR
jgi:hypothetical protein